MAFQEMKYKVTEILYAIGLEIAKKKNMHNWGSSDQTLHSENGGNCVGNWTGEKRAALSNNIA